MTTNCVAWKNRNLSSQSSGAWKSGVSKICPFGELWMFVSCLSFNVWQLLAILGIFLVSNCITTTSAFVVTCTIPCVPVFLCLNFLFLLEYIQNNPILNWLYLQRPCFQMKSHSKAPDLRSLANLLMEHNWTQQMPREIVVYGARWVKIEKGVWDEKIVMWNGIKENH